MHGNSRHNPALHHLYDIFYHADGDIFKYGISADPIDPDGLSARVREQMEEANMAAEFEKYGAEILLTDIPDAPRP